MLIPAADHHRGINRIAFAIALIAPLAAIMLHLVPALLAGLLIHVLVRSLAPFLERHLSSHGARVAAVAVLAVALIAAIGALTIGVITFLHSNAGSLPALMQKMAEVLESSRSWLPGGHSNTCRPTMTKCKPTPPHGCASMPANCRKSAKKPCAASCMPSSAWSSAPCWRCAR